MRHADAHAYTFIGLRKEAVEGPDPVLNLIASFCFVSLKTCGACVGDTAACVTTLIALALLHFAHNVMLVFSLLLHAAALAIELYLMLFIAIKAEKLWQARPPQAVAHGETTLL